jgi:hypothetical protein
MDLEEARKSLAKRNAFSTKKIAFAVVAGVLLVIGIGFRVSHYLGEAPAESEPAAVETRAPEAAPAPPAGTVESVPKTPPVIQEAAPAPSEPAEQAGETAEQTKPEGDAVGEAAPEGNVVEPSEQADLPGSGMILVARRPVEVLASPSASAPAMYGFPAGRPFRVIGREGGFVRIQDLKSSASGWIDETALAAPPRAPPVAAPSQSRPSAVGRKPATASADPKAKAAKKETPTTADTEVDQPRRPSVLFGRGGFFGGIFGNGNSN